MREDVLGCIESAPKGDDDGTIRFFDPATFKDRASVKAATNLHDFALTADRKTAYVPLYGDGQKTGAYKAANLHGRQRTVTVGKDPMGLGFSANGKTALAANHGDGTVSVIDLEKAETVGRFQAGTGIETLAYY